MKHRFYTLLFGVFITLSSFNLNAQGYSVIIDSVQVQPGQEFCVSVRTKEYTELNSFQFIFSWDSQVLSFEKTKNYNIIGLGPFDFGFAAPNHLLVAWANATGDCIVRDSNEAFFDVCFSAVGSVGSSAFITIDTGEAGICLGIFDFVPIDKDTGLVTIVATSATPSPLQMSTNPFQLKPNPTQTSTQLTFQSTSSAKAMLMVTNTLGQLVFQQNVSVQIGENQFEIPANILSTKGMYQVSLKTEQGVTSQMLSVQ